MSDNPPLPEELRAAGARARLDDSLGALQARLAPKVLAQNAVQGIVDKGQAAAWSGIDTARRHPGAVAGAIAAIGLLLARGPISRLFARKSATALVPKSSKLPIRAARRNAE